MLRSALVLITLISHAFATRSFWRAISKREIPNVIDFTCASIMLYYDAGLLLDLGRFPLIETRLTPLMAVDDVTFGISVGILLVLPWLLRLGARFANNGLPLPFIPHVEQALAIGRRPLFYWLAVGVTVPLAIAGLMGIQEGLPLWEARARIGMAWGQYITVLYLPLHFLAFYVCQKDAGSRAGIGFLGWLWASAAISTMSIGQRTNLLLPLVMIGLFRFRPSLRTIGLGIAGLIVVASFLLPQYKYTFSRTEASLTDLLTATLQNDLSRTPSVATAMQLSAPIGTTVLPYPLAGYVYCALFFVPRELAPVKGHATATYFTSAVSGATIEETNWGLGMGIAEEVCLNTGIALAPLGFVLYGIAIGFTDRIARAVPSLVVPTRLAGLWSCGYNLPAVLLAFGTMGMVVWLLDRLFCKETPNDLTASRPFVTEPTL